MPRVTLTAQVRGRLSVHRVDHFGELGIDAFVTDRFGGVSEGPYASLNLGTHVGDDPERVLENRRRVAEAAGVALERLVIVRQVHSNTVLEAPFGEDQSGDALFSSSRDHALAVLVADCVPVLLADESSKAFAVVHAGWRGLGSNVLANAVARFEDPRLLHAFVGPSISPEAYQVGPEVATHFCDVEGAVLADVDDRSRLDLRRVATSQLVDLGLEDANVLVSTQDTDGGELFFSDRAMRPCGRFALVARRSS